jgi:hypothetical protein
MLYSPSCKIETVLWHFYYYEKLDSKIFPTWHQILL